MPLTARVRESRRLLCEKVSGGFAGPSGWFDADGEILDFDSHFVLQARDADLSRRTSGMAMDIRQGLLHQPKNGRLQIARQPIEIVRELQLHRDLAAFGKSLDVHPESGSKPRFIEQRRVEEVGNRADILGPVVHQGCTIRYRARRLGWPFEGRPQ